MATHAMPQQRPVHGPGALAKKMSSLSLRSCKSKSNKSDSSATIAVSPEEYASLAKDSARKKHRSSRCRKIRLDGDSSPSSTSSSSSSASASSSASSSSSSSSETTRRRRAQMAVAASHVWALYMAGTPLFTRAALHSLGQQLDRPGVRTGTRNTSLEIQGMDGRTTRLVPTRSGTTANSDVHPDIVLVSVRPHIDYWTVEKLTGKAAWHVRRFDPALALLPMRIGHVQEARRRDGAGSSSSNSGTGNGAGRTVGDLAGDLARDLASSLTATSQTGGGGGGGGDQGGPQQRDRSRVARKLSVDEVRKVFQQQQARWEASDACRELRAKLRTGLARQLLHSQKRTKTNGPGALCNDRGVRKVVAFACSSMTEERVGGSARHAVQHAMVLTVRDVLEELQRSGYGGDERSQDDDDGDAADDDASTAPKIECIAQDPAYDAADLTVLAEAGITVVDDPYGFLAVDETTVVISVAPSVPVRQIVADIARPAAMIWGKVVEPQVSPLLEELGGLDDPASPRVRSMVRDGYDELEFPNDQLNFGTVDGMAIYIRNGSGGCMLPSSCGGTSNGLLQKLQRKLLCQAV